jgi:hypothetical protein
LEKLGFEDRERTETKSAHLRTKHGFTFLVKLFNAPNSSHFGCSTWRGFCKAYEFKEDMQITFDLRPVDEIDDNIDIWVDVETLPVLPICEFVK